MKHFRLTMDAVANNYRILETSVPKKYIPILKGLVKQAVLFGKLEERYGIDLELFPQDNETPLLQTSMSNSAVYQNVSLKGDY